MSDFLNLLWHGYVATPVAEACRQRGLLQLLDRGEPAGAHDYGLTPLYAVEPDELIAQEPYARMLGEKLEELLLRTAGGDSQLQDPACGAIVVPLAVAFQGKDAPRFAEALGRLEPALAEAIRRLFLLQGWLTPGQSELTPSGKALLKRGVFPLAALYRPLLHRMSVLSDDSAFMTVAASIGLFNDGEWTKRDYVVRHATEGDLDRLCELEELCWQHTRVSRERILGRVQRHPQGHFVVEKDGVVLGVIYSQRIADVDALFMRTAADVDVLHDPSGPIVQLLALNVDPRVQNLSYGDQLLEFMLQRCTLMAGISRVVGVTLCKSYGGTQPFDAYIREQGSGQDPVLAFHQAHGAEVVRAVPGYRPEDFTNLHNGVLVSYDLRNRNTRQRQNTPKASVTIDRQQIAQSLRTEAARMLGIDASEIDAERPVMEMGLDSADLLKLQRHCETAFGVELEAGFFFEYSTLAKVTDHLTSLLVAPAERSGELQADRTEGVQAAAPEGDIAVVGMSCKLPGGIDTPEQLWQVLSSDRCVIGSFPQSRRSWPAAADYPGIDRGGFVADADAFDAAFFRISPAEAQITDPQQRMLLELAWGCLEDAGIVPAALKGSKTGVFVGASNCDYSRLVQEAGVEVEGHHGVGSSLAILANRISYFFDLSGPSLVVDTACSSSLVALHTAIQSLRSGECTTAMVGGVNLITHPDLSVAYHKAGMLSADGLCKVFDASADGYVRSEGAVVLLLKPLQAAIADRNQIHGVIRGSAINHGGLAGGLTVPNPQKQSELLQAAWKDAGIEARDLTYIEAHGTGTSLGDPIEIQGIVQAAASSAAPCAIGSVKSNLGHLESAAGITGLLKILLSFRHQQLPASVNFTKLNPKIRLTGTPFFIQTRLGDWTAEQPRLAGVSSFGSGGANAHVVVQEYPKYDPVRSLEREQLFVLSAPTAEGLRAYAGRIIEWLKDDASGVDFADAIYTWQTGRTAMKQRLAIKVTGRADLLDKLERWAAGNGDVTDAWSGEAAQIAVWESRSGRQLVEQALWSRDFELLGTLWTSGGEIDWHKATTGELVSLPTYPFARDRYWIDITASRQALTIAATGVLHPLLHVNSSDLGQQSYTSTFSGDEFFLADHQVRVDGRNVRKVLPGVAYLEMARAAVENATPARPEAAVLELRNTAWVQPIVVTGKKEVRVAVTASDDDAIDYEIYSDEAVHCQGRALLSEQPSPAPLDLARLEREMTQERVEANGVYAACVRMGLMYGPSFQSITAIQRGNDQLLAHLRLPLSEPGDYVLHPSVMDGALQAALQLIDNGAEQPSLPFALESLRVVAPCTRDMVAWVRFASGSRATDAVVKLDLDLCDERGNVCVQMRGFSSRIPQATASLLATPVWQTAAIEAGKGDYVEHHVLSLDGGQQQDIARRYSDAALECFERIRSILESRPTGRVLVQLVVSDVRLAGLAGLLKTAALENPQFTGQLLLLPAGTSGEELVGLLEDEKTVAPDALVRYDQGSRQVLRWQDVAAETDTPAMPFQDDGVYLITGGTGALGVLFAKEILEQTRNARVVLTGRSAQKSVDGLGARASYRQLDLTDLEQVTRFIAAIQAEYGRLDGILHSAGMIADGFLVKKSAAQFGAVLAPKVTGTFNLDLATRDLELDFFVLFSSVVGATGNVGQADYAAANGFLDQFAVYRNGLVAAGHRHGRTRSINWPLWQAGGMGLDAATEERLQQTTGTRAMQTATGFEAFRRSLALPYAQTLVMEGDAARIRRALQGAPAPAPAPVPQQAIATAVDAESLTEKTQEYLRRQLSGLVKLPSHKIDPQAPLEEYGIDSILAMKLTNHLEETFGSLAKTLFFEYRTLRELTGYFVAQHAPRLNALFATAVDRVAEATPAAEVVPAPRNAGRASARRNVRGPKPTAHQQPEVEPIAIVGLSGRYPAAANVEAYWQNLRAGKDCIVEVPKERWDWQAHFTDDRTKSGRHYSKWGGFIEGVDEFDPLFFNIAPKEANYIDPQERLFLQHAWMAVEDAGYTRTTLQVPDGNDLAGQVGVYVGVMWSEYQTLGTEIPVEERRMGFAGNLASIANRVSYALNLHGPSMTLDTMCSSSLTAIHVACQDLKLGRTSLAIAGGVNVSIHPNKYLLLSVGQFISSDGHCQSFGEGGDGYIPGEGVGAVVLKRLSDAERDGDHIYGVIRGSALTHGGRTNGYTVPNPQAQTSAISRALAEAKIDARHVSYVEAHGTGTKLGDPIEIAALHKAFGHYTQDAGFCLIGSAKSNIGHCESAAGIAGLTKVLLQMQHRQIVPSLHSAQLNPHINFGKTPFVVNQTLTPWEQPVVGGRTLPRIAGISSFGAGGSNAHMIVEEYQAPVRQPLRAANVAIVLSARTAGQLQQKVRDLLDFLRSHSVDLAAMAYTLQVGREAMEERLGFVVTSVEQLVEKLQAYVAGDRDLEDTYSGQVKRNKEALAVFNADADLQQTVEKWIASRKLARLLDLWVKGLDLDWGKLYGDDKPQRVSLPAYPFARERYWIDVKPAAAPKSAAAEAAVLHPLLHRNDSDLSGQRYSSTFTGEESFLAGKTLPAAVCLDMARAAIEHAMPERPEALDFRDVVWGDPIVIDGRKQVSIELWSNDQDEVEYEIYSGDVVHGQGRAVMSREAAPSKLDVPPVVETPAPVAAPPAPTAMPAVARREIVLAAQPPATAPVGASVIAPVALKKRAAVSLAVPGAALTAARPAAARPVVTLTTATPAVTAAPADSSVRLYDGGNGVFSMDLNGESSVAAVLQALERAQQEVSLKVLLLRGLESAGDQQLARALVSFPYPVIAVLHGDATGDRFLTAALCDFMVCNDAASYGGSPASSLMASRFGDLLAQHLATVAPGSSLRAKGLACPIVPAAQVEAQAQELAQSLATKSQTALRLLKQHLTRSLTASGGTRVERTATDVLVVNSVQELIAALDGDSKAIVFAGTGDAIADDVLREAQRLLLATEIPVVAALEGYVRGTAWLLAQLCDACVYDRQGLYSAAGVTQTAPFARRLGVDAASELVLTGADYSGSELEQRVAGLIVMDRDRVRSTAVELAVSAVKLPPPALAEWPMPAGEPDEAPAPLAPAPIALRSSVVSATAHPDGVVVVKLEDRGAKNMFSDAFVDGVREAFAHIAGSSAYKVVVLTGYDTYFSSGGTKESLLAIQQGKVKFTAYDIYQSALDCRLPVVAAMQGHGIGAGWCLGMFADVVLLSEESRYVSPYMNYGFTPGAGATWVLPEKMGQDLARESLLTAQTYTGRELRTRGAALRVLPRVDVVPEAMSLARQIARVPRRRLIALKQQLTAHVHAALAETIRLELAMHDQTFVGQSDTLAQVQKHFHQEAEAQPVVVERPVAANSDTLHDVSDTLRALLASELQIRESEIDDTTQFVDLGLDSISGVTWIRKINEKYQTAIEATKVYSYPTLAQLSRYVREEAAARGTVSVPVVAATPMVAAPVAATPVVATPAAAPVLRSGDSDVLRDVADTLRALLANELQIRESEIDDTTQFVDLGLDSISGVTWIRKINEKYQTAIEATKVYSYPTLAELSRFVKAEAEARGTLTVPAEPPVEVAPVVVAKPVAPQVRVATAPAPAPTAQKLTSRRGRTSTRRTAGAPAPRSSQAIAVIGMAGQFPQARNLEEYWRNIAEGRNCISEVPRQRWDVNAYYQPGEPVAGRTTSQWAGMMEEYDRFDPLFFSISPTEAENMDPQQRLFLQACWAGIENAGYAARALSGSKCGVFVGCANGDYHQASREHQLSAQGFTGSAMSILAARISYFLNLQGACVSIDTACSSSLVALANACDSLVSGNSDVALAGGVYVMTGPEMHIKTSQAGMLSPEGKCFTFDNRADGFVPGEGVGVVMLKRLEDAQRDRDVIHAVIQGWGVNQDGKTNGITAPNPESQTRLEQEVYDKYQIDPGTIQLIEAHGTGTKLGDPIEVEGLKNAFRKYTTGQEYCALGSVKSNIGHSLAAAGIAGVLKLVLALKNKQLPPTINFERLNEHIDLAGSPFYVNTRLRPWEPGAAQRRLAATSSFGFSGTNAHVVFGDYQPRAEASHPVSAITQNGGVIVPLSARTAEQLERKARDLVHFIREENPSVDLLQMAYTLQVGREPMDERLSVLAGSVAQLAAKLESYVNGERKIEGVSRGQVKRGKDSTSIISQDDDIKATIVEKLLAERKLSKLMELWVNGLELDWNRFYGEAKPQRIPLPAYPFAKERYWLEAVDTADVSAGSAVLHPLLHRNTSDLNEQRYSSVFTGEEFFLTDHRVRKDKVLPGVAYLEMARAAVANAWPAQLESSALELRNTVWLKPVVFGEQREVSIALLVNDDDRVEYEVYSAEDTVHCQGEAVFTPRAAAARLDVEQLRRQMTHGRLAASEVYAMFDTMGLHYGPAHRGITAIALGDRQLLAQLRLPAGVQHGDYVLHPSLMDSALQASIGLIAEAGSVPTSPSVPFAVESLRILAACTQEMTAWVRYSAGSNTKLDVDLCDAEGNVCAQIRGFMSRVLETSRPAEDARLTIKKTSSPSFDDSFYDRLIADVLNHELSVDDALKIG